MDMNSYQTRNIIFGLGLVVGGSAFVMPLNIAAYLIGLMLLGFGFVPKAVEYPEDMHPKRSMAAPPAMERAPAMGGAPAPKKAAPKRRSRKKAAK
jgi:hypothetical protein